MTANTIISIPEINNIATIETLYNAKYNQNIYTIQNGVINGFLKCIEIKLISESNDLYEITFENNTSFICDAKQKIGLRNGEFRTSDILFAGVKLWRFHKMTNKDQSATWRRNYEDPDDSDITIKEIKKLNDQKENIYGIVMNESHNFAIKLSTKNIDGNIIENGIFIKSIED